MGPLQRDIASPFANRHHQLNFIVIVVGLRGIRQAQRLSRSDGHHRIGRLAEEKRWFAIRIKAHFTRVSGVVAAHAVNAAYRKLLIAADNRNANWGLGSKNVLSHDGVLIRIF
jgi:hypothetical protein